MIEEVDGARWSGKAKLGVGLLAVNLGLLALNLDKHERFPLSLGLADDDLPEFTAADLTVGDVGDDDAAEPASGDSDGQMAAADESAADSSADPGSGAVARSTGAGAEADGTWPGGHGPAPDGSPDERRAEVGADGRLVLAGSVPTWDAALALVDYAGDQFPAGLDAVDNQLSWHPDATADLDGGVVTVDNAVVFAVGETSIDVASPPLDLVAELLIAHPELSGAIVAYVDTGGDPAVGSQLAQARAASVQQYLIDKGAPVDGLVADLIDEPDSTQAQRVAIELRNFWELPQPVGPPQQ